AEDGIRDYKVTGVQTCALPISQEVGRRAQATSTRERVRAILDEHEIEQALARARHEHERCRKRDGGLEMHRVTRGKRVEQQRVRSEERRVGKGGRARWARCNRR